MLELLTALKSAENSWGAEEWILIADADGPEFDAEYVARSAYFLEVREAETALLHLEFFNSLYEDEGFGLLEARRILRPLLTRHNLTLESVEPHPSYMSGPPHLWQAAVRFSNRRRRLASLRDAAHEILRLLNAYESGAMTRQTARELLRAGSAEALVGQPESSWFDAKTAHFPLDRLHGKVDLALAVARFANASEGGLVVVGLRTRRTAVGEIVAEVTPVPTRPSDARRYRHIIAAHLYPHVEALEVFVVEFGSGQLVVIDIPAQPEESKPFLVHGAIVDGRSQGAFIGIVRRDADDSIPTTAPMIHATIAAGRALLRGNSR